MANKKLNQLVTKPSITSGDLFPLADATTGQLYKTTISDLGTAIGSGVSSVNTLVGAVVLDTDDIQELASPVNKWYTDLRARAALSAGTGISYNSGTGVITNTITQYTDAMARSAHSLTTTGSNGSATYNSTTGVLNVPSYTLSGLGGQPLAGNLTALAGLSYSSLGFIKMTGVGTLALDTNTYLTTSDAASTYALDSAVVKLTGNQTIAGQKTFSSTLFGTSGLFSGTVSANYVSISADAGGNGIYLTHNSSFNSIVVTQSGAGSAIYATGKLTVIGTAYISGQVQFGSSTFLTNLTQTITLPTSSGTLALTSQLSSYLPLAGGTLTGPLSGTSATFVASGTYTNLLIGTTSTTGAILSDANRSNLVLGAGTSNKIVFNNASTTQNGYIYSDSAELSLGYPASGTFNVQKVGVGSVFTITSSGNVGIGTTSPNFTTTNRTTLDINGTSSSLLALSVGGSNRSYLFQGGNDLYLNNTVGFIALNTETASNITFGTNNTERMRITSGGQVLVNKSSSADSTRYIDVSGNFYTSGSNAGYFFENRSNSANYYGLYASSATIFFFNGSANIASISTTTGVYTPLSDKNKKKDFELSNIGLSEIMKLKPTLYRMKSDETEGKKELGFIAQDVKLVIPNAYVESEDFIGLNYNPIVAALTKAVQELKAELDTLKNK